MLTACLCGTGLVSCAARRAEASDQRLTETACPDDRRDTLLTTDDLRSMTGEEIRVSFCRGEVFAKDIFLSSDTEHIAAKLDELFLHYERPDENFRYPDFESAPDGVLEPFASYGDIRVYIQEDSDRMKRTLKAVEISTGYSVYPSGFAYELNDPEDLIIEYNGADRVAVQAGSRFVVLDLSGELYYDPDSLEMTPYLDYYPKEAADNLIGDIHWIDEDTLEAANGKGTFRFTMRSYNSLEVGDDGVVEVVELPGPIEYLE